MSSIRNNVNLIGHLGADPEIRTTSAGKKYVTFRVATTDSYKDSKGEWQNETQWHSLISFDEYLADRAEAKLKKGSFIAVNGKLTYRNYTDNNNVVKYITEIKIENFMLLEKKNSVDLENQQAPKMDDLPF